MPHTSPAARMVSLLVATVLAAGSLLSLAAPAQAAPKAPYKFGSAIEALPKYAGQTKCSPSAKPGTSALSKMLLSTYKGSRSLGIVRACSIGGTSEHKEGRAFDWGLSAYSARDRGYANDFIAWALATDKYGNKYANARRLGIQYMIWNKRIWSTSYASSGWRKYTGVSPHTDHVHISLSWNGANKKTSFWTGKVLGASAAPAPVKVAPQPAVPATLPQGSPLVAETVTLDSKVAAGATTRGAFVQGQTYAIEIAGTLRYWNNAGALADAECTAVPGSSTWLRNRTLFGAAKTSAHMDVFLNGKDIIGEPDTNTGDRCDAVTHTYRYVHKADRTGRGNFRLWDPNPTIGHADNVGALTIKIQRYDAKDDMTWTVPATAAAGVSSPGVVRAGQSYVLTVSGTYKTGAYTADAKCSTTTSDRTWRRDRKIGSAAAALSVRLDKATINSDAVVPPAGTVNCDGVSNTYQYSFKAPATRTLNVRAGKASSYAANKGSLKVRLRRVVPVTGRETVTLNTAKAQGATTARVYPAGVPVLVRVSGSYSLDANFLADAECTTARRDTSWRSNRAELTAQNRPLGDATVNGESPTWVAASGSGRCNTSKHEYTLRYTPTKAGAIHLGVADTDYSDNSGTLTLTVEQTK